MEEIRMKKWNPAMFAEGGVVLAYHDELTTDKIKQLGNRAVRYSNATIDVRWTQITSFNDEDVRRGAELAF